MDGRLFIASKQQLKAKRIRHDGVTEGNELLLLLHEILTQRLSSLASLRHQSRRYRRQTEIRLANRSRHTYRGSGVRSEAKRERDDLDSRSLFSSLNVVTIRNRQSDEVSQIHLKG